MLLSDGAACRLIGSPVMLSGSLRRSIATIAASPIASMACGACDTSNACVEDAGADNKTDLRDVSCVKYPHVPNRVRVRVSSCGSQRDV